MSMKKRVSRQNSGLELKINLVKRSLCPSAYGVDMRITNEYSYNKIETFELEEY